MKPSLPTAETYASGSVPTAAPIKAPWELKIATDGQSGEQHDDPTPRRVIESGAADAPESFMPDMEGIPLMDFSGLLRGKAPSTTAPAPALPGPPCAAPLPPAGLGTLPPAGPLPPLPASRGTRCSLGVGCDESGVCYAVAMNSPEMCGAVELEANQYSTSVQHLVTETGMAEVRDMAAALTAQGVDLGVEMAGLVDPALPLEVPTTPTDNHIAVMESESVVVDPNEPVPPMRELDGQVQPSIAPSYKHQGVAQVFDMAQYEGIAHDDYALACKFPDRIAMQVQLMEGRAHATLQGYYAAPVNNNAKGRKPKPIYVFGKVGMYYISVLPDYNAGLADVLQQYLCYAYAAGVQAVRDAMADPNVVNNGAAMPRYVLRRAKGGAMAWHLDVNAHMAVTVK